MDQYRPIWVPRDQCWPILLHGCPCWPIWVPRDQSGQYRHLWTNIVQYGYPGTNIGQRGHPCNNIGQYWSLGTLACSRLLERCAKESVRGRKRGGNGGEKKRERRGACNHFLKHLMPPTFSKMCQHVKMSNFSLSRVSITCSSSRVRAVVHTSLRCRGHRKVLRVWDFNPQNPVDFAKKI